MKNLSRFCPELFKSKLAVVFLLAQLVFSAFLLDWDKMTFPIESIEKDRYKTTPREDAPSFGFYDCCYNQDYYEVAYIKVTFAVFSLPSAIVTTYLLVDLKSRHPNLTYQRFVTIGNLAFIIFNSVWWLFWGYLIERLHEHYLKIRSKPENPFTIFSDKN